MRELARVAQFDEKAGGLLKSPVLQALLKQIKEGEIAPPSKAFEGFDMYFYTDAKFGSDSWAANLCHKQGEEKLFSAAATLSYTLRNFHNDIEFANDCRLTGYVFPDGWPNNPELFAETVRQAEEEAQAKSTEIVPSKLKRFRQWIIKALFEPR